MNGVARALPMAAKTPTQTGDAHFQALWIVGAGAAGISLQASLKSGRQTFEIAPHRTRPISTTTSPVGPLVGAGIFEAAKHRQDNGSLIPKGVH